MNNNLELIQGLIRTMTRRFREVKFNKILDGKPDIAASRVIRGRAEPLSTSFENEFGLFLSNLLPLQYSILVDYPISYMPDKGQRKKTIYPDIVIKKDKTLTGIIELKIDVGYAEKDWMEKNQKKYKKLRSISRIDFTKGIIGTPQTEKSQLIVDPKFDFSTIILSALNAHKNLNQFENSHHCFILMKNHHPGDHTIKSDKIEEFYNEVFTDNENLKTWETMIKYFLKHFK